jgi:hypothetical protein
VHDAAAGRHELRVAWPKPPLAGMMTNLAPWPGAPNFGTGSFLDSPNLKLHVRNSSALLEGVRLARACFKLDWQALVTLGEAGYEAAVVRNRREALPQPRSGLLASGTWLPHFLLGPRPARLISRAADPHVVVDADSLKHHELAWPAV